MKNYLDEVEEIDDKELDDIQAEKLQLQSKELNGT